MTTIKLKNGSGAPTAGDLVQGEPALDLTNKRLYTEDSGGTVIEVGTNPTSITTGDITATGTVSFANLSTTGDITFGDNDKAIFGAGSDLQIYHDGSHSYIKDGGTGDLRVIAENFEVRNPNNNKVGIKAVPAAQVELYYDNATKLATTSSGIDVTGTVTASHLTLSDSFPVLKIEDSDGTNQHIEIVESSGASFITARNGSSNGTINLRRTDGTTTSRTMQITAAGDVALYANDGTTQAFYWDASTSRLGLGGTNPAHELHIKSASPQFRLEDSGGTSTYGDMQFNGTALALITRGGASSHGSIRLRSTDGTDTLSRIDILSNGDIKFFDDTGTEGLRWDASTSRLGLGTPSPSSKLHVQDTNSIVYSEGTGGYGSFYAKGSGTNAAYLFMGNAGGEKGRVQTENDGTIVFSNTTSATERMRIDSSGNLFIGKTSASFGTEGIAFNTPNEMTITRDSGTCVFLRRNTADGEVQTFYKDTSKVGSISVTSSATAYNTSSDRRLKDNIVDAPSASADIDAIQVRSFDWKADGSHQKYGMIAQELNTVAPEAVSGDADSDDMMGVDYSKLVPMLEKEIQSLRARVAQLEGAN